MADDVTNPGVSVVVPVYDSGPYLRPLLDSLDRQVAPAAGFEAIFVDDGSTDGTERLLDRWTATRPWARVVHEPNSGWPSRPRNVGIALARGEYVFFVDHDDWLADDALVRMLRFARENGSDVVIGTIRGVHRRVPTALFRETVVDARPPQTPLQRSMTPHAMFRRGFLDEERLRFDETARRVEDHIFVAAAYTRSRRTSVLAGEPVYFHARRDDGAGAGYRPYRAGDYYPYLARAIDIVCASGIPDAERDAYLGRWLRVELVGRVTSDAIRWLPRDERDEFFDAVRAILRDRIPASAVRRLSDAWRRRAELALTTAPEEFYRAIDQLEATSRPAALHRGILRTASRLTRGRVHRRLSAWGRTPILFARQAAAVASSLLALAAVLLTAIDTAAIVAGSLAIASLALTAVLAIRSASGTGTALRQALALIPGAIAAVRIADPPLLVAVLLGALSIAAMRLADRGWRTRDIRAHATRRGGVLDRLGWIGAGAVVVGIAVGAIAAAALVAGGDE